MRVVCRLLLPVRLVHLAFQGKKKKEASPQQRLYVRYLNPAGDGPCEICFQSVESETRHDSGGNLNPPNVKVRADAPNNISVYELWGRLRLSSLSVKVGEELLSIDIPYQTNKAILKQKKKSL